MYISRWRMLPDHTLRIENVQAIDEGVYVCTAENSVGQAEAVAHLRVECKFHARIHKVLSEGVQIW